MNKTILKLFLISITSIGITVQSRGQERAWQTKGNNTYTFDTVGIYTTPQSGYILSIKGNILCEQVKVKNSAHWPDYVFENNYRLMDLDNVMNYARAYGHLPGLPSANNIDTMPESELTEILVKKTEELLLYLHQIEIQYKKIEEDNMQLKKVLSEVKEKKGLH